MPFIKHDELKNSWSFKKCNSREHNPPAHIVLKPGIYTYKCPTCGKETTFTVPDIRC